MPAPIALFVYKRPWHTRQTLEALAKNHLAADSHLYIFADGPKPNASADDLTNIEAVRQVVNEQQWCGQVNLVAQAQNLGLANAIIKGVSEMVAQHGRVIVLEDDMITSPHFLTFMNQALDLYEAAPEVASITAYIYQIAGLPETFFLRDPGCWGWATWRRAWALFEPDGAKLLAQLAAQGRLQEFNYHGGYNYYGMLQSQVRGEVDSWAVRWYASLFLQNKLTLYPCQTLVNNIGNDTSGTHPGNENFYQVQLLQRPVQVQKMPLQANNAAYQAMCRFLRGRETPKKWWKRAIGKFLAKLRG